MEKFKAIINCFLHFGSEICGMIWGYSHALWLRNFISRLWVLNSISKLLKILCDNFIVVFFSKSIKSSSASKAVTDINYIVMRERVHNQIVSIEHIDMNLMIRDPFTKALALKTFKEQVYNTCLHILSRDF